MNQVFLDYYRCPESFANFTLTGTLSASCAPTADSGLPFRGKSISGGGRETR